MAISKVQHDRRAELEALRADQRVPRWFNILEELVLDTDAAEVSDDPDIAAEVYQLQWNLIELLVRARIELADILDTQSEPMSIVELRRLMIASEPESPEAA